MSNVIPFGAPAQFTVPTSARVTTFSDANYAVIAKRPAFDEVLFSGRGAYTSSTFSAATTVEIAGGGDAQVLYSVGTASVILELLANTQPTPGALNTTGALTAALMFTGIVTSSTASAVTGTLPTGPVLDAAGSFSVNDSFDWYVINTGATNAFTVGDASGHTITGATGVAASTSGHFRTCKTAANTFVTYRV